MDLLALLAAHPDRALPVAAVIDQLWPSLELDAPRAALDMAISRLRKLLGEPRAVEIAEGRVQLNADRVWSDVAEFQRLLDTAERCEEGPLRLAVTEQALRLYRGPLLGHERVHGLLAVQREALALRWLHALMDQGEALQRQGRHAQALQCYRRALAVDPLCEPLYRALIALYSRLGEAAQALHLYRSCTVALREGLGVMPAATTRALVESLHRP
jgi:DNA-binding SARP family transcriptional activator